MNLQDISLPRKLTQQLLHLAQSSPEAEVCGLVAADANGLPCQVYAVDNCADQPQQRFLLDAAQQIQAMQQMRDQQQYLFAIYHSHPHSAAIPSRTDIEQATYPEALHLIISLNTKGVLELRAYRISGSIATELGLSLIEA